MHVNVLRALKLLKLFELNPKGMASSFNVCCVSLLNLQNHLNGGIKLPMHSMQSDIRYA